MYFQIKEIILWPKKVSLSPRHVKFELGKVNIISGASRTGKSAIIPIIDYCLGSENCSIPVKTIRDSCAWFGVLIQTSFGQKLFARKEPGNQKSTGEMFAIEGNEIEIPENIQGGNTNIKAVKKRLDELAGLTNLDFDVNDTSGGFLARPSFRDFGAFIFQPQNIVANHDVLFYKADTYEHREKLKTIFPYVLGVITPETLALQHELGQLRKELRRKQNELDNIKEISEKWISEIKSQVSQAKEFGLIDITISVDAPKDALVKTLEGLVQSSTKSVHITEETVNDAVKELIALKSEESSFSTELAGLRKRFSEMSELKNNVVTYKDTLTIQRERLKISEWLQSNYSESHECPICGQSMELANSHLTDLLGSLSDIEQTIGEIDNIPPAFDRELERVRAEIRIFIEKLNGVRLRREALERSSVEVRNRHYETLRVERFIGNIERSLDFYKSIGTDGDLSSEIYNLKERISTIEAKLNENQLHSRMERALSIVNTNAERLLPGLDVERPNDPINLVISELTIKVKSLERDDYLWEIGSGSNWLSYHVALMSGLQQYFMSINNNPIPNFLIFDQPSQVYFPKKLATRENEPEEDFSGLIKDEDIEAVRQVFQTFVNVVNLSKGRLQIIVLDHASQNTWGVIKDVHLIEEWREGQKLIPTTWL